jgi:hypothetical protein
MIAFLEKALDISRSTFSDGKKEQMFRALLSILVYLNFYKLFSDISQI